MWPCKLNTNEGSMSWLKCVWKNQIIILLHTCCLYCSIASSKAAKKSVFSLSNRWICAWRWTILSSFSPSFSLSCLWLQLPAAAAGSCVIFLQQFHRNINSGNLKFLIFDLFTFEHEINSPGSLQKAFLSSMRRCPPWSCFQCRCLGLRQWSVHSVPPPPSTATHSRSDSVLQSELPHSVAPAAACDILVEYFFIESDC